MTPPIGPARASRRFVAPPLPYHFALLGLLRKPALRRLLSDVGDAWHSARRQARLRAPTAPASSRRPPS